MATGTTPTAQAIKDALGVLEGRAIYDGLERQVFTRVAAHDGSIVVDLGDDEHQAVLIRPGSWEIVGEAPVRFRRPQGLLPLPEPLKGTSIDGLRPFLNLKSDSDWVLTVAWLSACLRPDVPCPVLDLQGEQGSAKSTTSRVLRALVDPNTTPLRAEPGSLQDLAIVANNSRLVALDNLSHVPDWLSDGLCRLSTGGGFSTRALYSNDEEVLFEAKRPVLLNGIEGQATRSDLIDRSLPVHLPPIPEDRRRTEEVFWSDFEEQRAQLFGGLLTTVATALAELPTVTLDRLPRMADFGRWGVAVERAVGWAPGTFLAAYQGSRESASQVALESSPLYGPLTMLMTNRDSWQGTLSELLDKLKAASSSPQTTAWPRSPRGLKNALQRLAPNLRRDGLDVSLDDGRTPDSRRGRLVGIYRCEPVSGEAGHAGGPVVAIAQAPLDPSTAQKIELSWPYRERRHNAACGRTNLSAVAYATPDGRHVHAECDRCGHRETLPVHPQFDWTAPEEAMPVDGSTCPYGCRGDGATPTTHTKDAQRWWMCDGCSAFWLASQEWLLEPEEHWNSWRPREEEPVA